MNKLIFKLWKVTNRPAHPLSFLKALLLSTLTYRNRKLDLILKTVSFDLLDTLIGELDSKKLFANYSGHPIAMETISSNESRYTGSPNFISKANMGQ